MFIVHQPHSTSDFFWLTLIPPAPPKWCSSHLLQPALISGGSSKYKCTAKIEYKIAICVYKGYWPVIEIWTQACYINLFGKSSRQLSHALRPPSDTNPRSSASFFALRADGWYKNAPVSRLSTQCRPSSCVAWSFCSRAWFPSRLITFGLMLFIRHVTCPHRST